MESTLIVTGSATLLDLLSGSCLETGLKRKLEEGQQLREHDEILKKEDKAISMCDVPQ